MNVDPTSFTCPTHGHDLTPLVMEALDEQGPPLAFASRRRRAFEVIVSCPATAAPDGPHPLACEGRYWR